MKKNQADNISSISEQSLILAYLYDELSNQQRHLFEQKLKQDANFALLFEQQNQLDQLIKPGTQPFMDKNKTDGVHWSLHRQLLKTTRKQRSLLAKLANLWRLQTNFSTQLVGMFLTFTLGFLLAGSEFSADKNKLVSGTINKEISIDRQQSEPLSLIENDDYEIVDLRLTQLDPATGKVKVAYSLASQTQVVGNITDQKILSLLSTTMKNKVSDSTRLELVEVLKEYTKIVQVRDALSYSLLNDPNPGVRMAAAESLALLSQDKDIRRVLRMALQNDINSGIRVEAFQALIQHLEDQETIDTLTQYSVNDSNYYIRQQAKKLTVEQLAQTPQI